jgi:hypothetical protein
MKRLLILQICKNGGTILPILSQSRSTLDSKRLPIFFVAFADSVYEGLSKPQRKNSEEWLKNSYQDKNNIEKPKGDEEEEEEDELLKAIAKSNRIGARPKNPIELLAHRMRGLYDQSKNQKSEQ